MVDNQYLAGAIFSLIGIAILFTGYRFFRVALGIMGFTAGFTLVVTLGSDLTNLGRTELLASGVIGGIIFTFLFVLAYYAGVLIMGAFLGYLLGTSASPYIHVDPVIIIAVAVVLGGLITFVVQKVVIICISAFFGAWIFLLGIGQLFSRIDTRSLFDQPGQALLFYQHHSWRLLLWLVIALLGIIGQYQGMQRKKE